MSLTEKLVSLRKQKGLSQMELAEKLDISRQAISRWEVGTSIPSTENLKILSDLYGVPIDYLLNDNAENSSQRSETPGVPQEDSKSLEKRKKHKGIFLSILVVAAVILLAVGMLKIQGNERKQAVPMEDMAVEDGDEYSEVTLPFE